MYATKHHMLYNLTEIRIGVTSDDSLF